MREEVSVKRKCDGKQNTAKTKDDPILAGSIEMIHDGVDEKESREQKGQLEVQKKPPLDVSPFELHQILHDIA